MTRLASLCVTGFAALAFSLCGAAELIQGKEYIRLKNPQAVETGKKIEAIEFFSYGCPHCSALEPFLDAWIEKLPSDVQFRRVPALFNTHWPELARVYYTLDAMGAEARLTPEVFKAIHLNNLPLYQEKVFFDWAAGKGLDRARVADVYTSFAVNSRLNRAKSLTGAYNIDSVPTVVVDGKFLTGSSYVGTHAALPGAIDQLIAKARAERPKG